MKNSNIFLSTVKAIIFDTWILITLVSLASFLVTLWYFYGADWIPRVLSSLIAATLVGGGARSLDIIKEHPRRARFRDFFGYSPKDKRDIVIVVPFFETKEGLQEDDIKCELLQSHGTTPAVWCGAQKEINTGLKTLAAFEDLRAAASISSLFVREDKESVKIVSDKDWKLNTKRGKYTAISIGLFSNEVSQIFYEASYAILEDAFVSINPLKDSTSGGEIRIRKGGCNVAEWDEEKDPMLAEPMPGKPVHAVIIKVVDKANDTVGFVVGGLSEHGTSAAGTFLQDHWEDEIYNRTAQDQLKIGNRSFAMSLNVQARNKRGDLQVVVSNIYACGSDTAFLLCENAPKRNTRALLSNP
ncbi:MAG: hypothetical protein ACXWTP_00280 [Methylosarcina sp.]